MMCADGHLPALAAAADFDGLSETDHAHTAKPVLDAAPMGTFPSIEAGPEAATALAGTAAALAAAALPLSAIPALSSLPGAAASLYLDFDGHFDSAWGSYRNITTPAYDQDGNATSFSEGELASIRKIWEHVAEDFAPLAVNVTTVAPASFANGAALRAAIGGTGSWAGGSYGGVAYVNSFTNSLSNTVYVFPKNLGNGHARYVGEAVSHEAGHGFGLEHQSSYSATGALLDEYNPGTSSRAPIMGDSYGSTRGLWWSGANGNRQAQDDLAVLSRSTNGFGYRADDHGNTAATATQLSAAAGAIAATGVIHTLADADYFSFNTGAGQVTVSVAVPQGVNNLDATLELRSATGTVIASAAPSTSFGASITATVAAGTYYAVVASQGSYGDLGQYSLSGTVTTVVAPPPVVVTPPAAPTNFTARAEAARITLKWTDNATDETGYMVERRTDDGAWAVIANLAAGARSYVDSSIVAGHTHSWRVQAVKGTTGSAYSNIRTWTFPPAAPGNVTATAVSGNRVMVSWEDVYGEWIYRVERSTNGGAWATVGSTDADVTTFLDTTAAAGAAHQYRVRARNGSYGPYSSTASVTTPAFTPIATLAATPRRAASDSPGGDVGLPARTRVHDAAVTAVATARAGSGDAASRHIEHGSWRAANEVRRSASRFAVREATNAVGSQQIDDFFARS